VTKGGCELGETCDKSLQRRSDALAPILCGVKRGNLSCVGLRTHVRGGGGRDLGWKGERTNDKRPIPETTESRKPKVKESFSSKSPVTKDIIY